MAKKVNSVFICQQCGFESPRWMGQCECGAWNSFVEEKIQPDLENDKRRRTGSSGRSKAGLSTGFSSNRAVPLISVRSGETDRMKTGISELDLVLGGGFVKGSLTLISGEPGIGKSTLILQAASNIAKKHGAVLYVSGEESEEQVKMRADRICGGLPDNLYMLSETNMENISEQQDSIKPSFLIIDSIQTVYSSSIESSPGSVSQVRLCGNELMRIGKGNGIPVMIVAHVTKSGDLAGPKIVEHLVDTVLQFTGERSQDLRILRSFKNRFGTTNEIGAFEMTEDGLLPVKNLSETLMEEMEGGTAGSVATAIYEGTRPLLLEVQALTTPTPAGFARRTAVGIDHNRLNMIVAVLERHCGLSLSNQDIYVNIVGGIRPEGTACDLAVAMAVCSSLRSSPPPEKTIIIGEIGLTGELRSIQHSDRIVREAVRMGFKHILMPSRNASRLKLDPGAGIKIYGMRTVARALKILDS